MTQQNAPAKCSTQMTDDEYRKLWRGQPVYELQKRRKRKTMPKQCQTCGGLRFVALVEQKVMTRCPDCEPEGFADDCNELGL